MSKITISLLAALLSTSLTFGQNTAPSHEPGIRLKADLIEVRAVAIINEERE